MKKFRVIEKDFSFENEEDFLTRFLTEHPDYDLISVIAPLPYLRVYYFYINEPI